MLRRANTETQKPRDLSTTTKPSSSRGAGTGLSNGQVARLSKRPLPNDNPQVFLHVYDLGTSGEGQALNTVLGVFNTGAFHCGVEVYGKEWSFRGRVCSGTGVFATRPRCCEHHSYNRTITMGETTLSGTDVSRLIGVLQREWPGNGYDTLRRNCCHFSDKLCRCLGVGSIPSWVTSLANAGVFFVETGHAINVKRQSMAEAVSSTLLCDGRSDVATKVEVYDNAALHRRETW